MRRACIVMMVLTTPAAAQKSADTLRIAWRDALSGLDPYTSQLRASLVLSQHIWDTLIYRDPDTFQLKPLLATAWREIDATTLEFDLRRGVVFHDGSPFTAADVVYTVDRVLTDQAIAVPGNYGFLAGAERIEDFRVRIHLKRSLPAALEYLAMTLPILPQAYREHAGAAFSTSPVGTGPYRVAAITGTTEIDLDRNDAYFDGPKGHPAIAHVAIHEVPDPTTEVTELLGGRADWIWGFNPDQFDTISRIAELQAVRADSMRFSYLAMDAAGRSRATPETPWPLADQKVRQAIALAIDRAALARLTGQGTARVLDAACFPTQFGCDAAGVMHYDYDPARARRLLAEAGYPDGLETTLVSYLLPQYGAAIHNYLKAVGIEVYLGQLGTAEAVAQSTAGHAPLYAGSWGSYSINDVSAVLPFFFGGGQNDYARDPALSASIATGDTASDPDQRRLAYGAALRRIADQMYLLPLSTTSITYAFSRTLNFKVTTDELPRFYTASWR